MLSWGSVGALVFIAVCELLDYCQFCVCCEVTLRSWLLFCGLMTVSFLCECRCCYQVDCGV